MSDGARNEGVWRAMRLLAECMEDWLDGDETALETLAEALDREDVAADDLRVVALVLRSLCSGAAPEAADDAPRPGRQAHRVPSSAERAILVPEAWGYLLRLRSQGSLDAEQFERVLDEVSESGIRPVGVEHVREAAVRVAMECDPHTLGGSGGEAPRDVGH